MDDINPLPEQQSKMEEQEQPTFQELIETLIRLQGGRARSPLDVMQKQLQFLNSKVRELAQVRRTKMSSLRKRIEQYQSQACQQLSAAESFLCEIQKSLQQSQRECSKRLQKCQKQRLQYEIQINSLIDEHILEISQQNQSNEEGSLWAQEAEEQIIVLKNKIKQWKTLIQDKISRFKLEAEKDFRKQRESIKSISKDAENRIGVLRKRLANVLAQFDQKRRALTQQRTLSQSSVLSEIQLLISKIGK